MTSSNERLSLHRFRNYEPQTAVQQLTTKKTRKITIIFWNLSLLTDTPSKFVRVVRLKKRFAISTSPYVKSWMLRPQPKYNTNIFRALRTWNLECFVPDLSTIQIYFELYEREILNTSSPTKYNTNIFSFTNIFL